MESILLAYGRYGSCDQHKDGQVGVVRNQTGAEARDSAWCWRSLDPDGDGTGLKELVTPHCVPSSEHLRRS